VIWSECHCRLPKKRWCLKEGFNLRICKEHGRKRKSINLSLASCFVVVVFVLLSLRLLSDTFVPAIRCTMLPEAYADALNSTPHSIPVAHAAQPTERGVRGHQVLLLCLYTPVQYPGTSQKTRRLQLCHHGLLSHQRVPM
jgi:hypothetical protein